MLLENFINGFPGFVILKDINLRFNLINDMGLNLLKFNNEKEYIGKTEYEVPYLDPNLADYFTKYDTETINSGKIFKSVQLLSLNDKHQIFISTGSPIKNRENSIIGLSVYGLSITCPKTTNFLISLMEQDKEAFRSKNSGEFVYMLNDCSSNNYKFTVRETECLFYIIRGKTAKQIAKVLNLSPRTVEFYIERIKLKMDCTTKSQIVAKAISENLVNVIPESFLC